MYTKEQINLMHDSLLLELKESGNSIYNLFLKGYDFLKNNEIEKARNSFEKTFKSGQFITKSMIFYRENLVDINIEEDILYVSQILSLMNKTCHNLSLIYRKKEDKENEQYYLTQKSLCNTETYLYFLMSKYLKVSEKLLTIMEAYRLDSGLTSIEEAIGYIKFIHYLIKTKRYEEYKNNIDVNILCRINIETIDNYRDEDLSLMYQIVKEKIDFTN